MRTLWGESDLAELRGFVADHQPFSLLDWEPLAKSLGRTVQACRLKAQKEGLHGFLARKKGADKPATREPAVPEAPQGQANGDSLTHVSPLGPSARSEAEMLELFQVDVARWEVVKLTHNIWQSGGKGPDGELLAQDLCQTTLHLKRIAGADSLVQLTDLLLQSLRDAAPKKGPFVITKVKAPHMLEVDAFDLHLGKIAWGQETGHGDYDLSIATKSFREAFDDCLVKTSGFHLGKALLPVGNDLLQTDNLRSETTAGTRVDSDSRYHKVFEAAVSEMRWAIDRLLDRAPLVEVKSVSGNHDFLGGWTVARVLQAIYENDRRVVFDASPQTRKYCRWGQTLLGLVHGNEERHQDLPLIMATERKQDWAETLFHEWHTGHYHKYKKTRHTAGDTFGGVTIRTLRSLSGVDAWHSRRGFIGGRRAIEAFVYDLQEGEIGAFISRHPEVV